LGDLLTKQVPFARTDDDITVFDLTGLALQDLTVARMIYDRATEKSLGTHVAWPW
jgi:ornithine cyclodeaminase